MLNSSRNIIFRVRYHLSHYGLKATIVKVAEWLRVRAYLKETHVWCELPLEVERPRRDLPPDVELVRADISDLPLFQDLTTMTEMALREDQAREQIEADNDLWLAVQDGRAVFACWIFHSEVPLLAALGGKLSLAPGISCLEGSIASPHYRGRGVATGVWSQVADKLQQDSIGSLVTKIEVENIPTRRAVAKVGFREIAIMHFRRVGFRERTTVQALTGYPTAEWLAEQLTR
jgi:RimJ/RimL family protein N-acetyltransferase